MNLQQKNEVLTLTLQPLPAQADMWHWRTKGHLSPQPFTRLFQPQKCTFFKTQKPSQKVPIRSQQRRWKLEENKLKSPPMVNQRIIEERVFWQSTISLQPIAIFTIIGAKPTPPIHTRTQTPSSSNEGHSHFTRKKLVG